MEVDFTIDDRDFGAAIHALAELSSTDLREVIREETKAVLTAAVKRTEAATASLIRRRYTLEGTATQARKGELPKQPGYLTPYVNLDGNLVSVRETIRKPGQFSRVKKALKEEMKKALGRRGLAKLTWVLIGDDLGLEIAAPAYVRKAGESASNYRQACEGKEDFNRSNHVITIFTTGKTVLSPGGKGNAALRGAMSGRARYFDTNLKRGVFRSMEKIAKKYPGLFTVSE